MRSFARTINDGKPNSKIFGQKTSECNTKPNVEHIIQNCNCLLRIAHSLKYFKLTCKDNEGLNGDQTQKFVDFCTNSYPECLDDYIHFISKHSNNESLDKIRNDLQKNYELNICLNINKCQCTKRHYTKRSRMDKEQSHNEYNFYVSLFDRIHFVIYHLEALGLRVPLKSKEEEKQETNDNENYLKCTDLRIGEIQKIIENKRKGIRNFNMERLDDTKNSKFNIMVKKLNQNEILEHKSGIFYIFVILCMLLFVYILYRKEKFTKYVYR